MSENAEKRSASVRQEGSEAPKKVVEFQLDALEIANKPLPLLIRLGVWFPLIAVVGAIIWACLAQTDTVVQGGGKVVTDLQTIVMKPLDRVVIKSVDVKLGDVVTNDQVLIRFDPEINEAEVERLQHEITALDAQYQRLKAEFTDTQFVAKNEQFSQWQDAIYRQRQKYYSEKISYYDKTLEQLAVSKKSKQNSHLKKSKLLTKQERIEKMYEKLYTDTHGVSLKEYLEAQMQTISIDDANDQLANDILELDERRGSLAAEKEAFIQDWKNKISEELVNVERNLTSTQRQYDKQRQNLDEYMDLRAPCNAVVQQVAEIATPGSGVREAEALITLIPIEGDKKLEVEIRPEDIGHVKKGAEARIKLTAYPFQKYGTLNGVVEDISEDTLDRQIGGAQVKYYRARLSVSGELRQVKDDLRLKNFRLIPGMEAQCEIKCDRRRVIEYVLYPLIKAMDETAREP